jgi:hypothetical protein
MLLRELRTVSFDLFSAKVKVVQPNYSQWIDVQISAKNTQQAIKLLQVQYGPNATVTAVRRTK